MDGLFKLFFLLIERLDFGLLMLDVLPVLDVLALESSELFFGLGYCCLELVKLPAGSFEVCFDGARHLCVLLQLLVFVLKLVPKFILLFLQGADVIRTVF